MEVRKYFCPYCGIDHEDDSWTTDHIIPAAIGGPKRFTVIACRPCNNRIGREIEQPVLSSDSFKTKLGEMLVSGASIRRRRGKRFIGLGAVGLVHKDTIAKYRFDTKEQATRLELITTGPEGLTHDQLLKKPGFTMLWPGEDRAKNKEMEARLIDKMLLGCGHWLWGEKFSGSAYGDKLREYLYAINGDRVLDLPPETKHLVLKEENRGPSGKEVDALDNYPHTTVSIFEGEGNLWGLVNLLGGYESLAILGSLDPSVDLGLKRGIVVIANSTQNKVTTMDWDEYERYKDSLHSEI